MWFTAAHRVSRYLLAQSLVNGGTAIAVGLGLLLIGVPNALLWGLLAGLLRFVPYAGPFIAASLPVLILFFILQRRVMQTFVSSGIK